MGVIDYLKSLFNSDENVETSPSGSTNTATKEIIQEDVNMTSKDNINIKINKKMKTSELMMQFLKSQGFMPEQDGNLIGFKYQMSSFLYCINDEDTDFFQLVMPGIYDFTENNREAVLEAANKVNIGLKVIKANVYDDTVHLMCEMLLDSTPVMEDVVPRALNHLLSAQQEFYKAIN